MKSATWLIGLLVAGSVAAQYVPPIRQVPEAIDYATITNPPSLFTPTDLETDYAADHAVLTAAASLEYVDGALGNLGAELAAGRRLFYCVQRSFTNQAGAVYGILSTTPQASAYTVAIGPVTNAAYQQYSPGRGRITEDGLGVTSIPAGKFYQTLYFVNPGTSGRNVTMQIVASIVDADGENPVVLATSSEATIETRGDIVQRAEVDFVVADAVTVEATDRLQLDYYFKRSGLLTGTAPTITRHAGGSQAGSLSFGVPSAVVMLTDGSNATIDFGATNIVFAGHTIVYDAATRTLTITADGE